MEIQRPPLSADAPPAPRNTGRLLLDVAICLVGIAAAGVVDWVTGHELRTYPLYFVPISYGAWRQSRLVALPMAGLSAAVWFFSNVSAGGTYSLYVWGFNATAQLIAFGLVGYLINELQHRLAAEKVVSRQDALTGLPNTRAFYERGDLLCAIARRTYAPVTFAYVDLDNFKMVNDRHGHREGDRAIATAARILREGSRGSDLVARVGGDEFAMILLGAGPDEARASLERVRSAMAAAMRANDWPITVSVGALSYLDAPPTLEHALSQADGLMYRAKKAGKDCILVDVASEEVP